MAAGVEIGLDAHCAFARINILQTILAIYVNVSAKVS